jgi:hypothetical protein
METPPDLNDAEKISERITKRARGIIEYGTHCFQQGFSLGYIAGITTVLIPLAICTTIKVLQSQRIMRV